MGGSWHAKAGNLNNALMQTHGDFVLILDADQIPSPEILDRTLGYFDADPMPLTKPRTEAGPHIGWPHCAVGMQRALESAIALPSRSTNASRMLGFVTPPEVRRSFKVPPGSNAVDAVQRP